VDADRANNRITVKAVGIEQFSLLLNDALVDLDKEFTVIVNGKAMTQKLARSLNRVINKVEGRFDGDFVFPTEFATRVPKAEEKPAESGGTSK
jgi:mevalonate pyrophosphate decarboxylase